ncbi:MAG: hypothetical protein LBL62_04110, partial [Planctomycetaceae bacterium]|jgi:hypothetical protein|nr:hypothetical protein [Planctomycetaceae bacterium]
MKINTKCFKKCFDRILDFIRYWLQYKNFRFVKNTITNENLELCSILQTILDYEMSHGNVLQRVDRKQLPKIDLLVALKYPFYINQTVADVHIDDSLLQRAIKSSKSPLEIAFIALKERQAIACPADKDILSMELCAELRKIYDFEIKYGNKIDRIDRFAWDKVDLSVVFAFPFIIEKQSGTVQVSESVLRYVNKDAHYPLETSYTSKDHRQSIAAPNR